MTRDERQDKVVERWVAAGGVGTLEATTAFGKSRCATNIIKFLRRTHKNRKVLIVVPNHYLKEQWLKLLEPDIDLRLYTKVEVINTVIKNDYDASLVILDEIHRYAAHSFSAVFDKVKFKFILGLTATLKRMDHRHSILKAHAPVIDTITIEEAKLHGWVADYMEFNLAITLDPADLAKYLEWDTFYDECMNRFQQDFRMMQRIARGGIKPVLSGASWQEPPSVELARKYGWKGNTPFQARMEQMARKKDIWGGNPTHPYRPEYLHIRAINGIRCMTKIKSFIHNNPLKLLAAKAICENINVKTITFSELTNMADKLTSLVPNSVSYHSKVPNVSLLGKKLNQKKTLEFIVQQFLGGVYQRINSAKALDEGADFPEVQMGIRLSGTSSPTQHTQRRGRIVRKLGTKRAVMINLYLSGTKEMQWLSRAQGYSEDIFWVESVDEILEHLIL